MFKVLERVAALLIDNQIRDSGKLPVSLERFICRLELYATDEL